MATTILSIDGQVELGRALGSMDFTEPREGSSPTYGAWMTSDSADGALRVISYTDDQRVEVIGWATGTIPGSTRRYGAGVEAWRMTFSGLTPAPVVIAAIATAMGRLDIYV